MSEELLHKHSQDTGDFWVSATVKRLHCPSVVEFLRDGYSCYEPVILSGIIDEWPALSLWNDEYLSTVVNGSVKVNLTPDGHADCVKYLPANSANSSNHSNTIEFPIDSSVEKFDSNQDNDDCRSSYSYSNSSSVESEQRLLEQFVYPAEVEMSMKDFHSLLNSSESGQAVPYLSQQNDNLRTTMPQLLKDIADNIEIATEAFNLSSPEAINLWIGDERSVSSVHKDHFENMYAVISGEKTFTLLPPTDSIFMPENTYPTCRYTLYNCDLSSCDGESYNSSNFRISYDGCPSDSLPWIPLDPANPNAISKYPQFRLAHPIHCTVKAGEVLYIPAMWYHRVSQTCKTVAVNYWYDQRFDFR